MKEEGAGKFHTHRLLVRRGSGGMEKDLSVYLDNSTGVLI
jgi:hypothetical protein